MKKLNVLFSVFALTTCLTITNTEVNAQCAFDNVFYVDLTPTGAGNTQSDACGFGGDYITFTGCSGASYTITTCGSSGFDTQLTVYAPDLVTVVGYNDDDCGLQSTVTFVAGTNGTFYVMLDEFNCGPANATCQTIAVTQNTACGGGGSCTDNDDCAAPTAIAWATGVQTCLTDCNTGALPGPDFPGNNCQDFPGATVWYSVTTGASSATLDIDLTSANLTDPYFAVFTTADCLNYVTYNCTQGAAGAASATVNISVSTTYLIAISDAGNDQGNFDLCITVNDDNSACNTNQSLVVSSTSMGSPLNGPYLPGEVVSFCYTITDYIEFNCNYLQGVVPTFGDCWDPASFDAQGMPLTITNPLDVNGVIQPCPPGPPCAWSGCVGTANGAWSWFPAGSVNYNAIAGSLPPGTPMPAGWYFLSSYNPATGACTGGDPTDPDNSFGDGNFPNCGVNTFDYTLCFNLIARGSAACAGGQTDCSVSIKTYADGEIGAWNNVGCTADISSSAGTTLCCSAPPTVTTPVTYCVGDAAAALTATGTNLLWYTVSTGGVGSAIAPTPSTAVAGTTNYYVSQTVGGCESPRVQISVVVNAPANAGTNGTLTTCSNSASTNLFSLLGGSPAAGGVWTGPSALGGGSLGTYNPATCAPGIYTYTVTGTAPCPNATATVTVTENTAPSATISYAGSPYCTSLAGAQPVTQTGTAGGTYTAPAGLTINAATGAVTPSTSTAGTYTVTYTIAASGGCAAFSTTASVTITTAPSATISYAGSPYCTSLAGAQAVTQTGTAGGAYTAAPAGLSINAGTGAVTPSSSTPGTYTVTYTIAASGGCAAFSTTASVTITAAPTATISYAGSPYCTSLAGAQAVTQTGTAGGTYTSAPAGLTISAATGAVTPSTSTAGTYTVTYTIAASGGCAAFSTTASVTINALDNAAFTYASATYCQTGTDPTPTITGLAGGTFTSAPAGLVINAGTGLIDLSASALNTYTITYTTNGPCPNSSNVNVTVTLAPIAGFSYTGNPYCQSGVDPNPTFDPGATAGTFSAVPAGLVFVNVNTGQVDLSASAPGTYTVTNDIAASGGCASATASSSITINAAPSATISYAGNPFCTSLAGAQAVTQTGTVGGTYSAAPAGLTINAATGDITPSTSTAGTYTVTYTIPAAGGCAVFTTTASVTITAAPTATISYSGSPWCTSLAGTQAVTQTGTAGGTYTAAPAGLTISAATGAITPSTSTAGTYTVTYTIAASGGCAAFTTTASVTITTAPSATISYAGSPYCTSLAGTQPVTQTGTAGGTYTSAPAGLTISAATGAVTPSTSTAGTYTVTYTIAAAGGCAAFSTTFNVTITTAPTATISYAGTPWCTSVASAQPVTQTGTAGGTYTSAPAGLSINAASGAITPGTSTPGTYTVTYTIAASGGCAAFTTTASVTINATPSFSITGSTDPTGCGTADGTITLGGLTPSTTYTITYDDGTVVNLGAVTTDASGNYVITGLISGSYSNFTVTNAAGCTLVVTGPAALTDPGSPTFTVGGAIDPTTCGGTDGSITISGLNPSTTYDITYNDGALVNLGSVTTDASGNYVITGLGAGSYTGFTVTSAGCTGSDNSIITLTDPGSPVFAFSGSTDPTTCGGTDGTITITGLNPSTSYDITYNDGSLVNLGTVTTDASGNYVITGLDAGTYTAFTVTLAGCTGTDNSIITLTDPASPTVTASASTDPTTCSGTDGTITLSGLLPNTSYTITYDDGTVVNLGSVSTDASGNYVITSLAAGSYTAFTVTINGCTGSDNTTITLTDPASPAFTVTGIDPTSCGATDGSITISGLLPNTTYDYSYFDGTATISATAMSDGAGSIILTGIGAGVYDTFTVTLAGCTGNSLTVITLNDPGAPTFTVTGTNPTTCGGTDGTITFSGLTPSTSYDYSYFDGTSTVTITATSDASGNIIITGLAAGTYNAFTVNLAGCTGSSATVINLTAPAAPAAPVAGTSTTYCQGDVMADLTATASAGGTLTWYSDAGLTTIIGTGTTLTPSGTLGSTTYYVTETVGGCESVASTVIITITVQPATPVAGTDASYCSTDTFASMTAVPGSGGTITWYTDAALTIVAGTGITLTPNNVLGTTVYYVTETVGSCESTTAATVTITITNCDTTVIIVEIPTGFTPDGDGINDNWNIQNLNLAYPNNHVEVFNRWGAKLFESDGYATPWDGKYNSNPMPVGSYYFVIDYGDGSEPLKGTVTIIR